MSINDYIKRYLEGRGFYLDVKTGNHFFFFELFNNREKEYRISHGMLEKKDSDVIPYKDIYLYILRCSNPYQVFDMQKNEFITIEFMPLYPLEKFMIYTDLLNS